MTSETVRWVDNHCHLDPGADGDSQVTAARAAGVERFIDVGTDLERSRQAVRSAQRRPGVVFATVGAHPHDAAGGLDGLVELLDAPGVVAVGECGLDYYYDHSPREAQRAAFATQIGWANERSMPLVIHTRDAWDETFSVLDTEGMPERTVFHCFTGGPDEARAALDRGALLSYSGIVTFKNAQELRDAAAITPIDRLMVETDSPYLAPEPRRGKRNEPANLPFVGARVAEELGVTVDALAAAVWATTHRFYGLPAD